MEINLTIIDDEGDIVLAKSKKTLDSNQEFLVNLYFSICNFKEEDLEKVHFVIRNNYDIDADTNESFSRYSIRFPTNNFDPDTENYIDYEFSSTASEYECWNEVKEAVFYHIKTLSSRYQKAIDKIKNIERIINSNE